MKYAKSLPHRIKGEVGTRVLLLRPLEPSVKMEHPEIAARREKSSTMTLTVPPNIFSRNVKLTLIKF